MFSKLRAVDAEAQSVSAPIAPPVWSQAPLEPVSGGTLGLCFRTTQDGKRRFVKTHGPTQGARANLAKEAALLVFLEGPALHVTQTSMPDGRLWLEMDDLLPADAPSPAQIAKLVADYAEKLANYSGPMPVSAEDSLASLLLEGQRAFAALDAQGMFGPELQRAIPSYLSLLGRQAGRMPPCLCHGDLGPRNVLTDGRRLVAIDWEDAFWGVEGYDYLYWLTFFENRRHYHPSVLGSTPWGKDMEIAILLLVLTIKCWLSVRKRTHTGNDLSFDQRLMEVLALA